MFEVAGEMEGNCKEQPQSHHILWFFLNQAVGRVSWFPGLQLQFSVCQMGVLRSMMCGSLSCDFPKAYGERWCLPSYTLAVGRLLHCCPGGLACNLVVSFALFHLFGSSLSILAAPLWLSKGLSLSLSCIEKKGKKTLYPVEL